MILSFEQVLGKLLIARRGFHGNAGRGRIVNDSRKVLPGDIFVAIPGTVSDGHNYIDAAIRARAEVVIHQHPLSHYLPYITYLMVTNTRLAYARCCREFSNCPDLDLPLFGVTGTNGKTTTVYLIEHLLRQGFKLAHIGQQRQIIAAQLQLQGVTVQKLLAALCRRGRQLQRRGRPGGQLPQMQIRPLQQLTHQCRHLCRFDQPGQLAVKTAVNL
ncbi:MAG: hypothetical protein EOM10_12290 [Opitutae bacterium]|nr:hypothetical protein [Opitutae bacterium]